MAEKRVIAHFMHEYELRELMPHMRDGMVAEGLAAGMIDEHEMERLTDKGIVFELLGEPPAPSLVAIEADEPVAAASVGGWGSFAAEPVLSDLYTLTLAGPLFQDWRGRLEGLNVEFREALPGFQWLVRIRPERVAAVRALAGIVVNLKVRSAESNLPTRREVAGLGSETNVREMLAYDVLLTRPAHLVPFRDWLTTREIPVACAEENKVRVYLLENDPRLSEIASKTEWVVDIQPYVPPTLHNDRARVLLGVDGPATANPQFHFPWEGEGELVAVADTGIDDSHPDFAGRILGKVPLGRAGDWSDPHGHGTHVAGSVLGDGNASNGVIRGPAPRANLFFQSLLDKKGELGGLPFRLGTLFGDAYAAGARIHNNSWGSVALAAYRVASREVDEYVHGQQDMLIVISAGNEGTSADPPIGNRNSQAGFVDWLSISAPATAKNALTVGASQTDRTTGGYATLTYSAAWPQKFPGAVVGAENISGNTESMAGFSSRGPCDDYRIKPDVVAPGTDILSCRSSTAPLHRFWGPDPVNLRYAYMGGTSMAAPLVSGCAALVRQYYRQVRSHSPSAALLKATLINSTRWLAGASATADFSDLPNFHQGFGCVFLPLAVPNAHVPGFGLEFYDNWNNAAQHLSATGQRRRFQFGLNAGGALRVTLAYTDPPGRSLQNNLNLFLQLPDQSKKFGNMDVPFSLNRPDAANNVEIIRLENAPPGPYMIQVVASNLLQPQDFALVVTGDFSVLLTEV